MTRALRKAHRGAVLTFVLAGLMCGTFTVRLPALAERLRLPESSVGLTLLSWGIGALLTMQLMRVVLARIGSRGVLRAAAPLCAASLVLVAFAPSFPVLAVSAALFGMAFGAVDVGMNAQGSAVERAYGRPIMSGLHAGWCVGAISAGLLGTGAIALGLSLTAHILVVALVSVPAALALSRLHLPDPAPETDETDEAGRASARARRRLPGVVYLLGAVTFAAFMVEGVVADWNGLYLIGTLHASEAVAALGYPVFEAGMLLARLAGDRLRGRYGARGLIMFSGAATALAFLVVIAAPVTVAAVAGLFFIGLSVATISPMALSLAGTATREPGPAIAQASTMGYAGLLLGPVVIGFLSAAASLRLAMGVAVVLGVVITVAARLLPASRAEIIPLPVRPAEEEARLRTAA
ncbi:MFS transporter [Microbispora bryophytorum]|uniref:MFS transporter n=1 Tax=Microbispora bryophytorum TaxID=1460882 RepID=A0A8H9H518_9ACTN|nr:MFS transporter [Microbispora bryophytorum]MBD3138081.1 MFS transporter [Microbispora bryophytorum]TQS05288.1 MFS transporter [Microbispora bryophytorum]GGO21902.1 MFS transporter [Microbispora bryophytorum]